MTDTVDALRAELAVACRILAREGQNDFVWGHVSVRDPKGRGVWMKRSGIGFDEIRQEDSVLIDRAGAVLEGAGRRHAEYPIHTEILAVRDDVNCVVHTHAPHAVAFAATGQPLRPVSHEATFFVPPDIPRFTETSDLILTPELGKSVVAALGDCAALFLLHHGVVVAGVDIPETTVATVLLDRACQMQLQVMAATSEYSWTDNAEAVQKRGHCYPRPLLEQAWDYLVRIDAATSGLKQPGAP